MYIGVTKNLFDDTKSILTTQDNMSMDNMQLGNSDYTNLLGYQDFKICLSDYDDKVQGVNNTLNNIVDVVGTANSSQTYGVHEFEVIFTRLKDDDGVLVDSDNTTYENKYKVIDYIYYNSYKSNGSNTGLPYTGSRSQGSIGEYEITLLQNADRFGAAPFASGNFASDSKFKNYAGNAIGMPFRNVSANSRVQRKMVGYYNNKSVTNTYANNLNNFVKNITPAANNCYTKKFDYNSMVNTICDINNQYFLSLSDWGYYQAWVFRDTYLGFSVNQPTNSMIDAFHTFYISGTHLNTITSNSTSYYQIQNLLRFRINDYSPLSMIFTNDRSSKWIISVSDIIYSVAKGSGSDILQFPSSIDYKWGATNTTGTTMKPNDTVFIIIKNRVTTDVILNIYKSSIDELAEIYANTNEVYADHTTINASYSYPYGSYSLLTDPDSFKEITKETVYTQSELELQRKNEYQDMQGNTVSEWIDVKKYQIPNTEVSTTDYLSVEQELKNLLNNTLYRCRVTNYLKNTYLWSLKEKGGITSPVLDVLVSQYKDGIPYTYPWHEFSVTLPDAYTSDFLINQCSVETASTCEGYINVKCKFNNKYSFELNEFNPARNYIATSSNSNEIYLTEITGSSYLKIHDFYDQFLRIRLGISFGVVNNVSQTWTPLCKAVMTNDDYFTIDYSNSGGTIVIQLNYRNSGGTSLYSATTTCVSRGTCTVDGATIINMYEVGVYFSDFASHISDNVMIKEIYFQGDEETDAISPSNLYVNIITVQKNYNDDLNSEDYTTILNWYASETDNATVNTIGTDFKPYTTELELKPYGDLVLLRRKESDSEFAIIGYHKLWYHNYSENTVHWIGENEFEINDIFVPNNSYYVYALGGYRNDGVNKNILVISNPSVCTCNRFMISDKHKTFTFIANVQYGSFEVSSQTTYQVAKNRKYPYVMDNSNDNFNTSTISLDIVGESFLVDGKLNRTEIEREMKEFIDFLKSKTTKVIKDWNGKSMMIYILPQPSYSVNLANDLHKITFNFVEVGDLNNEDDLEENNTIYGEYEKENQPDFSTETEV